MQFKMLFLDGADHKKKLKDVNRGRCFMKNSTST